MPPDRLAPQHTETGKAPIPGTLWRDKATGVDLRFIDRVLRDGVVLSSYPGMLGWVSVRTPLIDFVRDFEFSSDPLGVEVRPVAPTRRKKRSK